MAFDNATMTNNKRSCKYYNKIKIVEINIYFQNDSLFYSERSERRERSEL